jgi:hypothetical protein
MLYLHEWQGDFEEVVLLRHSGSLGFRLTSLAAIPLHTAAGYKGLAAKTAFSLLLSYCFIVYWFISSILYILKW